MENSTYPHPSQFFQSIYDCWCNATGTKAGTPVYATIRWMGEYAKNEVWDLLTLANPKSRFWKSAVAAREAEGMDAHLVWASLGTENKIRSKRVDLEDAKYFAFVIEDDNPDRPWQEKVGDCSSHGLPTPSMQVWTGSKSIHHIYMCGDANLESLYGCFQQYARISISDGFDHQDNHLNIFRVKTTRIPGIKHKKTGKRSQLLNVSTSYRFTQLWNAIAPRQMGRWNKEEGRFLTLAEEAKERAEKEAAALARQSKVSTFIPPNQSVGLAVGTSFNGAISIPDCLVGKARDYWLSGAAHGERFPASGTVLSQLLAAENFLQSHCISSVASAYDCWREWAGANHLSPTEAVARWRSMSRNRDKYLLNATAIRRVAQLTGGTVQSKKATAWTVRQLIELANRIATEARSLGVMPSAYPVANLPEPEAGCSEIQILDIKKALNILFERGAFHLGVDIAIPLDASAGEVKALAGLNIKIVGEIKDEHVLLAKKLVNSLTIYTEDCGLTVPLLYLQVTKQEEVKPSISIAKEFLTTRSIESSMRFSRLVGIKSPLGSGKTTALKEYLAQNREKRALVVYARQMLSESISSKLCLPCYSDGHPYLAALIEDGGGVYCLHSLKSFGLAKFNVERWGDELDILVLDEVESTFDSLLNDENVSIEARQNFLKLLVNFASKGGTILAMDANLSSSTIELMESLTGLSAFNLKNDYAPAQARKLFVLKDNKTLQSELIKSAPAQKVAYACDRRRLRKSNNGSTQLMREFLADKTHTVCVDSHSQHTTDDKDYQILNDTNSLAFKAGALLYSPTVESGYSIDKSSTPFQKVFASFDGAISINSATQMLARVRDDAPRYLVVRKSAIGATREIDLEAIKEKAIAASVAHQAATENVGLLLESLDSRVAAYREYKLLISAIEGRHYREALIHKLVSSGHYTLAVSTPDKEKTAISKEFAQQKRDEEIASILATAPIEPKSTKKHVDLPLETQRAHTHFRFSEWINTTEMDDTSKVRAFSVWDSARRSKVDFCVAFLARTHEENETVLSAKALNPDNGMMLSAPQIAQHSYLSRYALLAPHADLIKSALVSRQVRSSAAVALLSASTLIESHVFAAESAQEKLRALFSWFGFTLKPSADIKGAYDLECSEEFEAALFARLNSPMKLQKEATAMGERLEALMMKDFSCYGGNFY